MTCSLFKEFAHDYFLQRLPAAEVERLDAHVRDCPDCSDFLRICKELSCRDFVEFLSDYIDGSLGERRRAVFDRHLAICSDCRNYLDSFRRVAELSVLALGLDGLVPGLPVPEELVRAVLEARHADDDPPEGS